MLCSQGNKNKANNICVLQKVVGWGPAHAATAHFLLTILWGMLALGRCSSSSMSREEALPPSLLLGHPQAKAPLKPFPSGTLDTNNSLLHLLGWSVLLDFQKSMPFPCIAQMEDSRVWALTIGYLRYNLFWTILLCQPDKLMSSERKECPPHPPPIPP